MKKWYDIYPKGTAEGDIEEKIFKILTRNRKWKFRSVLGISKELKIKEQVIEKMILKYSNLGIILQNPQNHLQWGYWETCGIKKKKSHSVQEYDYKMRIKKAKGEYVVEEDEDEDESEHDKYDKYIPDIW